ncbi:hypothetical protein RRG08_021292 [Elysia crispata]|uniref:Uncharacterized protein n=1 Tax=Elysia crispata TaxID=231223 RepID=A0AAE1DDP9_9GAST|nr:hypothetical protein RRG08_021292 [Elysia crispata]
MPLLLQHVCYPVLSQEITGSSIGQMGILGNMTPGLLRGTYHHQAASRKNGLHLQQESFSNIPVRTPGLRNTRHRVKY